MRLHWLVSHRIVYILNTLVSNDSWKDVHRIVVKVHGSVSNCRSTSWKHFKSSPGFVKAHWTTWMPDKERVGLPSRQVVSSSSSRTQETIQVNLRPGELRCREHSLDARGRSWKRKRPWETQHPHGPDFRMVPGRPGRDCRFPIPITLPA